MNQANCNRYLKMFVLLMMAMATVACGNSQKQSGHESSLDHEAVAEVAAEADHVFVCTGPNSKRYHYSEYCKGLSKCSCEVVELTGEEAEKSGNADIKILTGGVSERNVSRLSFDIDMTFPASGDSKRSSYTSG